MIQKIYPETWWTWRDAVSAIICTLNEIVDYINKQNQDE